MASLPVGAAVEDAPTGPAAVTAGRARRRPADLGPKLLAGAALVLLAGSLVLTAIVRAPQLSLLDEWTHADYAYRISHGEVPADGDAISREIREEWSCHRLAPGGDIPPCGQPDPPPADYTAEGQQYNSFHPPVYYAITGVLARAIDAVRPGLTFITAARLVGLGWLLAGMAVFYLALRRFEVGWPYAAAGVALLPLTPIVLHASSTVTNDAAAALAGSLALLVLARVLVQRRTGWLLPAAATLFVSGTKMLNGLPMLVVAGLLGVLAIRSWRERDRATARSLAVLALVIVGTFLAAYLAWSLYQASRGDPNWVNPVLGKSGRPVRGLPFDEIFSTSFTGFSLTSSYYLQPLINGQGITAWAKLLSALVVASPFVALAAFRPWRPAWLVGAGLLAGMLLYPLAVELQVYLSFGRYFPQVVVRYGMSFIPWALAVLVMLAATRRAWRTGAAVLGMGTLLVAGTVTGVL